MRKTASPGGAAAPDSAASSSRSGDATSTEPPSRTRSAAPAAHPTSTEPPERATSTAPAGGATSSTPANHASTADSSAGPPSVDSLGPTASPSRAARLVLLPIRLYQRFVSPALPRRCKYHPTCSQYAVQAIQGYGILRGAVLAGWRLLRCNPWSHGGYDPVSAQTLFRRAPRSPGSSASDS